MEAEKRKADSLLCEEGTDDESEEKTLMGAPISKRAKSTASFYNHPACDSCDQDDVRCYRGVPCRRCKKRNFSCSLVDSKEKEKKKETPKAAPIEGTGEFMVAVVNKEQAEQPPPPPVTLKETLGTMAPAIFNRAASVEPFACGIRCMACKMTGSLCVGGSPCLRCKTLSLPDCGSRAWPWGKAEWELDYIQGKCDMCGAEGDVNHYKRNSVMYKVSKLAMCCKCAVVVTRL